MTDSVFRKIVTKENSYSQLLCNLMIRDDRFCRKLLAFFLDETSPIVGDIRVREQKRLPKGHGQPDLVIETPEWYVIVEVKTENHCARTKRQELDAPVKGYLSYLKTIKGRRSALVFLVPRGWKFRNKVESDIKKRPGQGGISITLRTWEQLVGTLPDDDEASPLLYDFRLHLEERFGSIKFNEDEVNALFTSDAPISTALKLNAFLEQLREKFGKPPATEMSLTNDEVGFYMKAGNRWLLFVGCWLTFWNEGYQHPICFGTEDDGVKRAFRDAFQKSFGAEAITFEKWTMGWISAEDFNSPDAVEASYKKLSGIWRAVEKAAKASS